MKVGVTRNLWATTQGGIKRMNFPLDSLALYLPLWHPELSGTPIISKDLNAHSCTVTGTVHTPPTHRVFDGTDDKIVIPDCAALSALGAFTFFGWAKLSSNASGAVAGLFSKDSVASPNREFIIQTNASDKQQCYLFDAAGTGYLVVRGTNTVADDAWHLWTVSWSGVNATSEIVIQLDDVEEVRSVNSKTGTGYVAHDGAADFEAGRSAQSDTECWEGDIGEIVLITRQLTVQERSHYYRVTKWRWQ